MSEPRERIVLVGFMGAGKTTVARSLALQLGWTFKDLDAAIEERHQSSVAQIFEQKGEAFFREEERRLAEEARQLGRHVIAAGGGAFAEPATREALQAGATTVWLRCDLDTLMRRVGSDPSRPLAGGRERMKELLTKREAAYRLADIVIDTTDAPPDEIAALIVRRLFPAPRPGTER